MSQPTSPSPSDSVGADIDAESQDMAATLGFSSFGAQEHNRQSKKRRFDAHAEGSSAASSSGANSLPLHPRETTTTAEASTAQGDHAPVYPPGLEGLKMRIAASSPGGILPEGWYPDPDNPEHRVEEVEPPIKIPASQVRDRRAATAARLKAGRPASGMNPLWYVDYYDPSSNQNPWERLEQAKGLAPVGPWLPAGPRPGPNRGRA